MARLQAITSSWMFDELQVDLRSLTTATLQWQNPSLQHTFRPCLRLQACLIFTHPNCRALLWVYTCTCTCLAFTCNCLSSHT